MGRPATSIVKQRQDPLRERYRRVPSAARVTDHARTIADGTANPFHGTVAMGKGCGAQRFGLHGAVGGNHDLPTPGDLLCAALASCLDTTIRTVADRLAVRIAALEVGVSAEADLRGALIVDPSVPVGFQRVRCCLRLRPADDTEPARMRMLLAAAEYGCVVLQTLRKGVAVEMHLAGPIREAVD